MPDADALALMQRRFDRERAARKAAEAALEGKAQELYAANEQLRVANAALAGEVAEQATARRASEARGAAVVDAALDAVVAVDAGGTVLAWNRQAAATFGWAAGEAVGRHATELIVPPAGRPVYERYLADLVDLAVVRGDGGEHARCRFEHVMADRAGREFPVEVAVATLPGDGGPILSLFLRDLGEQQDAERRRDALYGVTRVLADAGAVSEALGRILAAVGGGLRWAVGFAWMFDGHGGDGEAEAYAGTPLRCVAEWLGPGGVTPMVTDSRARAFACGTGLPGRVWETGRPAWITDVAGDDNFPRRPVAVASGLRAGFAFPILSDNRFVGAMEFFHRDARPPEADLLALFDAVGKQIGQFVRRRRAEVEAEAARAQAEAARGQAERASAAKSEFLARMSHELRTPLNGVIGTVDLLAGTRVDDHQRRYLSVAKTSAEALLSLINDILDFSKIEAGHMQLEAVAFDPGRVAEDVVDAFAPVAAKKGVEVAAVVAAAGPAAVPAAVVGDPVRFRQVVTNLVSNALKFTAAGRVAVRVTAAAGPAGGAAATLRVEVDDTGPGIPPDKLDRLFKSFSQADVSTTRTHGGTGLGLAICKRIVELMGGTIGVDSTPGRGSTFGFAVPLPVPGDSPSGAPATAGMRVRVVDPSPASAELVAAAVAAVGGTVVTDGPAAVTLVAAGSAVPPGTAGRVVAVVPVGGTFAPSAGPFAAAVHKPLKRAELVAALTGAGAAAPPAPAAAVEDRPPPGTRVLLVDDNEINQMVAGKMLAHRGYACDTADNGRLAVEAVAAAPGAYAVVLMDCSMPEMDGFEATRRIRSAHATDPAGRPLPVLALTAEAIAGDRDRCLAAGMDGYVTKPIRPAELFAEIRRVTTAKAA